MGELSSLPFNLSSVFPSLEVYVIVPTNSHLQVNKTEKECFLFEFQHFECLNKQHIKLRLCSFHPPFSLQAFIETMFASKAPVEEGFLYAKVSF